MKRLLFAGMASLAAIAPASASAEQVNGTGQSATYPQVHVNAKDNGDGPRGHVYFGAPPGIPPAVGQSDVTCLRVEGNTARIGAVQRSTGFAFFVQVIDNGSPGRGNDEHRVRPATQGEVTPPDCNPGALPDFTPFETIVQGNYVVKP
jgi:hypothetical protein